MKLAQRTGSLICLTVVAFVVVAAPSLAATMVNGAGATFPLPLYQRWGYDYGVRNHDVRVTYAGGG